jgi:hypothetical protein
MRARASSMTKIHYISLVPEGSRLVELAIPKLKVVEWVVLVGFNRT